ncbi:aspartate aminotransferase family protein [Rhodovarius crocodyli]|uniref:Aspartate aminotransferase family protein n=1 Tax=Rhodovarius crocodyli TaxID=1979269 RepID=A0A437MEB6_9PROT|nr:aspartate aminotransferase family protein [Rhodovarius crocodyli]RVT95988.1 aspartate aminotransferase family protein [Rhodovarius crocodyli]
MTPPRNSSATRDIATAMHPYTDARAHEANGPMIITRGEGVRVWDDQGRSYIDTVAGLWCAALGFSNERLVQAATAQMRKLPFYHAFTSKSHEPLIDLSEMLVERAPVPMSKAFFCNSGSEANDTAVKMIWYYNNAVGRPQKKKIISRVKGYHGVTVASASLTGLPANHKLFDLPIAGVFHTTTPHYYHEGRPGESEEEFATRCASDLEELILREGPETVAAMFMEPVMGAGGVIVPPKTYYEKIQAVLKKYDVLIVADEVICGFGRTGEYWGCTTFGIEPDILTCAKALSSSFLPISGVLVNDKVYQGLADGSHTIGTFGHGYTYSGHPVSAAVAVETLKIYDEMDIVGHVKKVAPLMQAGIQKLASHPLVGDARGVGLIGAIELVEDKAAKKNFDPARKIAARAQKLCEAEGLIMRILPGDGIAFSPPLVINEEEVALMMNGVTNALDKLAVELRREGFTVV